MLREIQANLNKWTNFHLFHSIYSKFPSISPPWIERLNIVKSIFPKLVYSFDKVSNKIPPGFFLVEIGILDQEFTWKCKESGTVKTILKKKKAGGLTLSDWFIIKL